MNPTAIYSKSGKGVQEASGKTSILKRPERAVLSAIDGRATLAEVAEKVGKPFDAAFEALITQLDKDGFVREVNPGVAPAAPKAPPAAKGKAATPPPSSDAPDLDFSAIAPAPKPSAPPPKPSPARTMPRDSMSGCVGWRRSSASPRFWSASPYPCSGAWATSGTPAA